MCPHLHKDGEEDDGDDGSEEHVLCFTVRQQESQREGYGTSQATVGHDELVFLGQFHDTEFIDDECKTNDSWNIQKSGGKSVNEFINTYMKERGNTALYERR